MIELVTVDATKDINGSKESEEEERERSELETVIYENRFHDIGELMLPFTPKNYYTI